MKDLTNSNIDRQNILNNKYAIDEIQKQLWIKWFELEWKIRFTKKQISEFYWVDERTVERYLEKNDWELVWNWYEVLTGERLNSAKNLSGSDINVGTKITVLWLFDFRSFLNIGMLLQESERAKELRRIILDITIDVINQKIGWNTKYINTRDEQFLSSYIKWEDYRKNFIDTLREYVDMWNIKYAMFTDKVYSIAFQEKAKEYKAIIWLSNNEPERETFYSEVLDVISGIENWVADMICSKYKILNRKLSQQDVIEIFEMTANNKFLVPIIEKARLLMASRDLCFRDIVHEKLQRYIWAVSVEDFERFIWERSMDFEKRIEETKEVIKRLQNR
jgi:hypothetical protein